MSYRRSGLAAYPSDTCFYDPNRPSWLPYFIDTPTESQNKIACTLTGTPTTLTPIMWAVPGATAAGPALATVVATPADTAATQDSSPGIIDQLSSALQPTINLPQIPSWVTYAAIGVGALLVLNLAKGLR